MGYSIGSARNEIFFSPSFQHRSRDFNSSQFAPRAERLGIDTMFNTAFSCVRGASRIQARSLLRPSTRNACDVIASAARGRHEKGWKGSQQSHKSSGHGQRDNSHFPLRLMTVAGFSVFAAAVSSDNSQKPPRPEYAYKDPSGWRRWDNDSSIFLDHVLRTQTAMNTNSIEEARSAHFDFTRAYFEFCVHGEVIDEGSLPSDIVFGPGRYVKKEDTKVFWMPSPVLGKSSILCVSVHYDLGGDERDAAFLSAIGPFMCTPLLEKFKEDDGTYIFIHVFSAAGVHFAVGLSRDILERHQSLMAIQE